jgi:hypothetical protein
MPDCQPFSIAFNRLTMPGFHQFARLFEVAHFERIGGSLYSGMVAQYGADYSRTLSSLSSCFHFAKDWLRKRQGLKVQ